MLQRCSQPDTQHKLSTLNRVCPTLLHIIILKYSPIMLVIELNKGSSFHGVFEIDFLTTLSYSVWSFQFDKVLLHIGIS